MTTAQTKPEIAQVIDAYSNSPEYRALVAQQEAARLADRREKVAQLAKVRALSLKAAPARSAKVTEARQRVEAAHAAFLAVDAEHRRVVGQVESERHREDREIEGIENELAASASPLIAEFLRDLREDFEKTRRGLRHESRFSRPNIITGKRQTITYTNAAGINGRIAAISEARQAAEALRYEPLTEAEVEERLRAMWAALPGTSDVLEQVAG